MILASKVDIISAGLVQLGHPPVSSLDENTRGVTSALAVYDIVRRSRLAEHPWRFALREENLTPIADETDRTNDSDYDYAYTRPSDAVFMWGLADRKPFGLYGDQIHSNADPAKLIYVADLDGNKLFPGFAEAMALEVATAAAIPYTESVNKAQYFRQLADRQWKKARSKDSQQAWLVSIPVSEILYGWPQSRG